MDSIRVYVSAHKIPPRYTNDPCYKILHVGAEGHSDSWGDVCDNMGNDNISSRNPTYCELTGLYWIWKNARPSKYVGLCHYRRYPAKHNWSFTPGREILRGKELLELLQNNDILLPQPMVKSAANSLCQTENDLARCRSYLYLKSVLERNYPEYLPELREVFMAPEMSFGNIFVMQWDLFTEYCQWLFSILFDVETIIQSKNDEIPREYGYFSEWLLNVWVRHQKLKVQYIPVVFTEEKNKLKLCVKWLEERLSN